MRAIQSTKKMPYPATFITYHHLRGVGHLPSHEEARGRGLLHVIDTWEALFKFTQDMTTLFVSHQWLSFTQPDPEGTLMRGSYPRRIYIRVPRLLLRYC